MWVAPSSSCLSSPIVFLLQMQERAQLRKSRLQQNSDTPGWPYIQLQYCSRTDNEMIDRWYHHESIIYLKGVVHKS
uniref:Uncharacterized protein n=1 Tax=Oryza brachyantha TaxID=4533 RepID=J3KVS2_ORYBR